MTDLGNNLFAVSVTEETYGYSNWNNELFYKMSKYSSGSKPIGFDFEILGTVTASDISFDVEPHLEKNNQFSSAKFTVYGKECTYTPYSEHSFRSLLSFKGLFFENPLEYMKESCKGNWQGYEEMHECWQKAENNLVQKLIILKRL